MAEWNEDDIVETDFECISCGHTRFVHTDTEFGHGGSPFVHWPWLQEPIEVFMCARCGYMHWFGTPLEDQDECIQCGEPMAEGETVCPSCGWTYDVDAQDENESDEDLEKPKE